MRGSLARRLAALFAVALVVLFGTLSTAIVITEQNRAAANELADQIAPSRRVAGDLLVALVEQQNDIRGYALRGEDASLQEYRGQQAIQDRAVAELMVLLPADPGLRADLDWILAAAAGWRADAAEPIVAAVGLGGPRPATDGLYQVEQQQFAPLRAAVEQFRADLQLARDRASQQLDVLGRWQVGILVAGVAAVLALIAVAALLARRWVIAPLEGLAADARQVAAGDYGHEITVGAAPSEIAALAADLEQMRSGVVADRNALAAAAHELARSNEDLEQFAYVASHDLQEPLRKVSSFCQLLQRRYAGQLDERADQYIEFAVDGAQRMQELVNDLLAFSRVGRTSEGFVPVELAAVTKAALGQLEEARERVDGEVIVGELPAVRGDVTLLTQLMLNLIGNGLKFGRPGVPVRVEVGARPVGDGWEIWVADNGVGIDPQYADKVFVIFQRLNDRDAYPGTGIGLALAKKIVEFHGGRIWLDTDRAGDAGQQAGATVRFVLPTPAPTTQEGAISD